MIAMFLKCMNGEAHLIHLSLYIYFYLPHFVAGGFKNTFTSFVPFFILLEMKH